MVRHVWGSVQPASVDNRCVGPLLGLLIGRRGSVSGMVLGHGLAPSSGIYPRELKHADLSLISGLKSVPLLLLACTRDKVPQNAIDSH